MEHAGKHIVLLHVNMHSKNALDTVNVFRANPLAAEFIYLVKYSGSINRPTAVKGLILNVTIIWCCSQGNYIFADQPVNIFHHITQ